MKKVMFILSSVILGVAVGNFVLSLIHMLRRDA